PRDPLQLPPQRAHLLPRMPPPHVRTPHDKPPRPPADHILPIQPRPPQPPRLRPPPAPLHRRPGQRSPHCLLRFPLPTDPLPPSCLSRALSHLSEQAAPQTDTDFVSALPKWTAHVGPPRAPLPANPRLTTADWPGPPKQSPNPEPGSSKDSPN